MNISMLLDMSAEAFGDRVAIAYEGSTIDYAELRRRALAASQIVRDSGAEHLALLDVNSPATAVALFGAAHAAVPYVPLNYRLTDDELAELVERIAPALVVVGPEAEGRLPERAGLTVIRRKDFLRATDGAGEGVSHAAEDPSAIAVQLFTSGTTGKPKAAVLRHENLSAYIIGTVEFGAAGEDEANLVSVPPYHIAGISAILSSTYACRRMAMIGAFEPVAWVTACREQNATNCFIVPTMLSRIIDRLEAEGGAGLPSLRAVAYGGGRMPQQTIERAMQLLPQVDFTNAYGLTETSSTVAVLGPDDHRLAMASDDPKVRRRLASAGQPTGAVEIQVRDDADRVLGPEEAGLVFVRGPQVSGEYLSLGSQLDADGWFPTKDRGYLDADGYLYLDGREDDVIVRGGENISPGEIEDVLLAHPAVADVAVVAVPDEQWGEGVGAAVVLEAGQSVSAEALQALVREHLRSSRVPQVIVFRDALPYNEMGKVLRRIIRGELAEAVAA
ncbi:class I adenylate-forming enzyme family protein [Algiphilus sp.]|uniref:class I adenylate-forming enzyme family protein n=1 Tax=Algiphilus sp. TaxID=1872431 RepID=UPI0025BA180D|nr:class I adenylate-forming enzyme family protein [Algiphilus sp.]MCK5769725.1 acyl--CoA ligase [Algiphilus sp.]